MSKYGWKGLRALAKRVILITGTPCVGKTTVASLLTSKLDGLYVNLTNLALEKKLILGRDRKRKSIIVDEGRMKRRIRKTIRESEKADVIVDGHYAASVVPKELVSYVFVLRRDPVELQRMMMNCGFSEQKMRENLASEILDVCLVEALNVRGKAEVCELNATGKSARKILNEILKVLQGKSPCQVGTVDWLGKLENEGLLDEYLRI
jgi:adenylate kinase